MDIGGVTSSVNTASAQGRARQTEQDGQALPSSPAQATPLRSAQVVDESEAADRSRAEAERTQATVNVNGQVVGTRINTTA